MDSKCVLLPVQQMDSPADPLGVCSALVSDFQQCVFISGRMFDVCVIL